MINCVGKIILGILRFNMQCTVYFMFSVFYFSLAEGSKFRTGRGKKEETGSGKHIL